MANKKISALTSIGTDAASGDLVPINDISDTVTSGEATGTTKSVTVANLTSGSIETALRGTDNPHIGGFPNQSLRVIDNPDKSVVVVADADGNLDFVVKSDSSRVYLNTPSSRLEMTTGVSVVEDSSEPDIEITTSSGTYSMISGDSDSLSSSGLPTRQGFNSPDIGGNQAPLLISGGSIA